MKILLIKMGATMLPVKSKFGDYESWFERALGKYGRYLDAIDAVSDPDWSQVSKPDGCIISGSAASVYEDLSWSIAASDMIEAWRLSGVPILGVCYGHQLLAQNAGARVALNPSGREIGVCQIERIVNDPLFDGLPLQFSVVQTHSDAVLTAVPGGQVIASNGNTQNQAMAMGQRVRSVQWHPEMTAEIIEMYIELREPEIIAEFGSEAIEELRSALRPVTSGQAILKNFVDHFILQS